MQGKHVPVNPQVVVLMKHWQQNVGAYIRSKRKTAAMKQKEAPVRQTLSLVENAKLNFTLQALLEVLLAVGGDISEAFHSNVPLRFSNPHHQMIHQQLQDILENAPPEAVSWISGNIITFHDNYVKRRQRGA